jgi:hypothetical protein
MSTWIFQANPQQFDLDGYLATGPGEMLWLAKQNAKEMRIGDQVFLWRAIGQGDPKLSGIVAEAWISSLPALRPEAADSLSYWRGNGAAPDLRVGLDLHRIELRNRFKRSWFDNDPIMSKSGIMTVRTGTNFKLTQEEADRLNALWRRAGVDWNYAEALAGLWAYWKTLEAGRVSTLPNSPMVEAALRTGRVVGGMYNKVMNFRALDPTDPRKGLSASSHMDSLVWNRFFDQQSGKLRGVELEEEYARLWPAAATAIIPPEVSAEEAAETLTSLSLQELLARFAKATRGRSRKPRTYRTTTNTFERKPIVVAIARVRAGDCCEVPGCSHPLFTTSSGESFIEVHHIEPLAEGGPDEPENVACVCPSHHREAHHGKDAAGIRSALQAKRNGEKANAVA